MRGGAVIDRDRDIDPITGDKTARSGNDHRLRRFARFGCGKSTRSGSRS